MRGRAFGFLFLLLLIAAPILLFASGANAQGIITTVAGNGTVGFSGDSGPATSASLANPSGVAVDSAGNLFIADQLNHRIRRVDASSGVITTVAGNGSVSFSGDGGPATSASLAFPVAVVVDSAGNLFIVDQGHQRIRRVDAATSIITTVAGTGCVSFSGDGGPATSASLANPSGVAVDGAGNLFIGDAVNRRIRRVDGATSIITTVAGTGTQGFSGDGGPATSAQLGNPFGVALDSAGTLFIADQLNHRIRRVDAGADGQVTGALDETITTVAGNGLSGFSGDGGPATSTRLGNPFGVMTDSAGNLFISDTTNQRIRRVDAATGVITTVAGTGVFGFNGDGIPATSAHLTRPSRVAVDSAGNLFIADEFNHRVRRVTLALIVDINIKPGSDPNAINPADEGLTPVAILTTDTFDATTVSPITVQFGPAGASIAHRSAHLEDVDGDGDLDLVLHFRTQETGILCSDTETPLAGQTFDGRPLRGADSIVTVGCT